MSTVVVGALIAIAVLLVVPVRVSLVAVSESTPPLRVHVAWLLGLVRFEVKRSDEKPPRPEAAAKAGRNGRRKLRRAFAILRAPGLRERTSRFLRSLLASAHPRVDHMYVALGLGDPADTGQAWAILGPLSGWLAHRYGGQVQLVPDFVEERFVIEGRARATLVPAHTLGIVLGFITSPTLLRGLYLAHRAGAK